MSDVVVAADAIALESVPIAPGRGRLRRLWSSPAGLVGLVVVGVLAAVAVLAAVGLTPDPPLRQNPAQRFTAPSTDHWLGTDQFGRDIASR